MKRIMREIMRDRILLALTAFRPMFICKRLRFDVEADRETMTDALVVHIIGQPASEAVVLVPDFVGDPHTLRLGRWDEDEPHPFPNARPAESSG